MSSIGIDLRVSAAGRATLHAEHRAEARLADAHHCLLAEAAERIGEPDERRALSFTGRGRIDAGDEHEAAARRALRDIESDLGLVLAVEIEVVAVEAELRGDVADGAELGGLGDLDVGGYYFGMKGTGSRFADSGRVKLPTRRDGTPGEREETSGVR